MFSILVYSQHIGYNYKIYTDSWIHFEGDFFSCGIVVVYSSPFQLFFIHFLPLDLWPPAALLNETFLRHHHETCILINPTGDSDAQSNVKDTAQDP